MKKEEQISNLGKSVAGINSLARVILLNVLSILLVAPEGFSWAADQEKKLEELEKQVKELREEIMRMKSEQEKKEAQTKETVTKIPSQPMEKRKQALEYLAEKVRIGGYGSFRYEATDEDELNNTFTFRRFVLTADATPVDNLRTYMELEFERFSRIEVEKGIARDEGGGLNSSQSIESSDGSEISMEQAWLQYDFAKEASLRIGEVLVPLGRFNLFHDDNLYDFNRRPITDKQAPVLPVAAAWSELGAGLVGNVGDGLLNYQVYVMNGATLDGQIENVIESNRIVVDEELKLSPGGFDHDLNGSKAVSGRLAFSPFLGSEIAGSFYVGEYTPDFLDIKKILTGLGADFHVTRGPFDFEGEYLFVSLQGADDVVRRFAHIAANKSFEGQVDDLELELEFEPSGISKRRQGFWVSGVYHLPIPNLPILGTRFSDPELRLVGRYELVDIDDLFTAVEFEGGNLESVETDDRTQQQFTFGIAYRPTPLIGFILNVEYSDLIRGDALLFPSDLPEDNVFAFTAGAVFGF